MLLSFLLPPVCELCGRELVSGERLLCLGCLAKLAPGAGAFPPSPASPLRDRLPRRVNVATCGAWALYRPDSPAARLIKKGKYENRPDIIRQLAATWGKTLAAADAMRGIDALQAVPMHILKRLRRGYNQAALIAREISRVTGVPLIDAMRATREHSSQTRTTASGRADNVRDIFSVTRADSVAGKHVALVDDIVTTGATLSEAATALERAGALSVSVFTLAAASEAR